MAFRVAGKTFVVSVPFIHSGYFVGIDYAEREISVKDIFQKAGETMAIIPEAISILQRRDADAMTVVLKAVLLQMMETDEEAFLAIKNVHLARAENFSLMIRPLDDEGVVLTVVPK